MIDVRLLIAVPVFVGAQMLAAEDMVFTIDPTTACLDAQDPDRDGHLCAGRAAGVCMERSEGGYTTVGIGRCLDLEFLWWDDQLNAAYAQVLARATAHDAEVKSHGGFAPSQEDALREMQRAWIPFRDRLCDFERSQWGGGTGGGPAAVGCLLTETARQTLFFQDVLEAPL